MDNINIIQKFSLYYIHKRKCRSLNEITIEVLEKFIFKSNVPHPTEAEFPLLLLEESAICLDLARLII